MTPPYSHDRQVLGLAPMGQHLGLVVLSHEHLHTFTVLRPFGERGNPRSLVDVGDSIVRRIRALQVSGVAFAEPVRANHEFAAYIDMFAREQGLELVRFDRTALRAARGGTYRELAVHALRTYPELHARIRLPQQAHRHRGMVTSRETPMWALALALAAAEQGLAARLVQELPIPTTTQTPTI